MDWSEIDALVPSDGKAGRETWERVLDGIRARMLGILLARGVDRDLAEDVTQDALLLVWLRWPTLRDRQRLGAWVVSILLNRLRSHMVRRREMSALPERTVGRDCDPLRELLHREGVAWIRRALESLPRRQREPVQLRIVEGLSPEAASDALAVERPRLRRRLYLGLRTIRRMASSAEGRGAVLALGARPMTDMAAGRTR